MKPKKIIVNVFSNGAAIIQCPLDMGPEQVEALREVWKESDEKFGAPLFFASGFDVVVVEHDNPLGVGKAEGGGPRYVEAKVDVGPFNEYDHDDITLFLAARLVNVYGESPNTDYIQAAEKLANQKVKVEPPLPEERLLCSCSHGPHIGLVCGHPLKEGDFHYDTRPLVGGDTITNCPCEG
jgi:hypothetical protein